MKPALICQAIPFALYHYRIFDSSVPQAVGQFMYLFLVGLALGYAFHKRRNLVAPICLHICFSLIFIGSLVAEVQSAGGVGSWKPAADSLRKQLQVELQDGGTRDRFRRLVRADRLEREERTRAIVPYLDDSSEPMRLLAATLLVRRYSPGDPALREALTSRDQEIVQGVLLVISIKDDSSFVAELASLTNHKERTIRASALMTLQGLDAVSQLIDALESPNEDVRKFAFGSLRTRTNDTFGYNPAAAPEEHSAAVERWREWWKQRGDNVSGPR